MRKNKKLRVAIDAHMLGDKSGGNETYYRNILQNMQPSEDMEIILFVKQGIDISPYQDKFMIVRLPDHRASIRNLIDIPWLCIKYHVDVLHMQYFIPFFRPCPVVTTIHDICFEHYRDIFTWKEYVRQKVLVRYAAKHSERIVTVSNFSKQDICSCYGIPKEKVTVTYNAVDEKYRKLSPEELDIGTLRQKYDIKGEYILSVCNLQPRKNLKRLILAYNKLCRDYQYDGQLVIVGKKAWMYDEIFSTAENINKKNGETDRILFTDYVSEEDLLRLYNGAKCFVYPSYYEGFGIPPLEALACGTPVAVSSATALPEAVGAAGVYFDPFDVDEICESINRVLTDIEENQNITARRKISKQVSRYSWCIAAEKLRDLYEEAARR